METVNHAQTQAVFALMQDGKKLGEIKLRGGVSDDSQEKLAAFAVNFINGKHPVAPPNSTWENSDEPNRMTLVEHSNNESRWLLVLTQSQ